MAGPGVGRRRFAPAKTAFIGVLTETIETIKQTADIGLKHRRPIMRTIKNDDRVVISPRR
jgi:hypothetical protein